MKKQIAIVFNQHSCTPTQKAQIADALADLKQPVTFIALDENTAKKVAKGSYDTVVAVGGDGTVSAVADMIAGTAMNLGVIPQGTLNHFAKDLGIPLTIVPAIQAIVRGTLKKVDYGMVNSEVFINNSSIGLYPRLVRRREKLEPKLSKWPAAVVSSVVSAQNLKRFTAEVTIDGETILWRTAMIFVGNNSYQLAKPGFNNRDNLTGGMLSVYCLKTVRIHTLVWLMWRIAQGKPIPKRYFERLHTKKLDVRLPKRSKPTVWVALDGEVKRLSLPLHYAIHSGQCSVWVPRPKHL